MPNTSISIPWNILQLFRFRTVLNSSQTHHWSFSHVDCPARHYQIDLNNYLECTTTAHMCIHIPYICMYTIYICIDCATAHYFGKFFTTAHAAGKWKLMFEGERRDICTPFHLKMQIIRWAFAAWHLDNLVCSEGKANYYYTAIYSIYNVSITCSACKQNLKRDEMRKSLTCDAHFSNALRQHPKAFGLPLI